MINKLNTEWVRDYPENWKRFGYRDVSLLKCMEFIGVALVNGELDTKREILFCMMSMAPYHNLPTPPHDVCVAGRIPNEM